MFWKCRQQMKNHGLSCVPQFSKNISIIHWYLQASSKGSCWCFLWKDILIFVLLMTSPHAAPWGDESVESSDKNKKAKKEEGECETDDRSRPLSERSSPGVNIAFPRLPQLRACLLVHLLQRVKMEETDTPVGRWEYSLPSQGWESWTHTCILLQFNAAAVTSSVSLWLKWS